MYHKCYTGYSHKKDIEIVLSFWPEANSSADRHIGVFSDRSCWSNSVEGNHPFELKTSRLLNLCSHPLYLTQMPMSHKHSTQGSNIMQQITANFSVM